MKPNEATQPPNSGERVNTPLSAVTQPWDGHVTIPPAKPRKILRLPAVVELCGMGKTSIYMGEKNGTFPARVRLSARLVGWNLLDVERWIEERVKVGASS
jgi:prophage regulatory protein